MPLDRTVSRRDALGIVGTASFGARLVVAAALVAVGLVAPPVAPLALVGTVAILLVGLNDFEGLRAYLTARTARVGS